MQDVLSAPGKRALDRLAGQAEALFAFDFDGTLARIVQDRHAAALTEPIRAALHAVAVAAPTAVISGRSLDDLRPRIEGISAHLIGNHGLEGLHTSERVMHQAQECCRAWLKTVSKDERNLTRVGVIVEEIIELSQDKTDTYNLFDSSHNILIVEDNPVNMLLAKTILKKELPNCNVIEAVNGNEAVKEFTKNKIDIIFMDIQMPELDGYDATMLIRKMETGKRVPIIALTAGILKGEQTKCLEIGMDDYIPKPVVKNSIKKVLHNWLFKNDLKENSKLENEVEVIKKHFDIEQLKQRVDGDEEVTQTLLSMGKENLKNSLLDLNLNYESKNLNQIKKIAHQIKGSALNLCFDLLALLALKLESVEDFNEIETSRLLKDIESEIEYLYLKI